MKIKCIGCGATIQTENVNKKGYIDKKVLENRKDQFYCKRCFDLKHYNKDSKILKNEIITFVRGFTFKSSSFNNFDFK